MQLQEIVEFVCNSRLLSAETNILQSSVQGVAIQHFALRMRMSDGKKGGRRDRSDVHHYSNWSHRQTMRLVLPVHR